MLGEKSRYASNASAPRQFIQRRAALAKSDCLIVTRKRRKQIAEAPYSAKIHSRLRQTASPPLMFQFLRVRPANDFFPTRIRDLQQVGAFQAAEILTRGIAEVSAPDAAKTIVHTAHGLF